MNIEIFIKEKINPYNSGLSQCRTSGQAAIEYLLILSVAVIMILSFFSKAKDFFIQDGPCPNESLICQVTQASFGPDLKNNHYRFFKLAK